MKRRLPRIMTIIALTLFVMALPSCRSSKKSKSEFYESQLQTLKKDNSANNGGRRVSNTQRQIIDEAMGWLGTPYAYGRSEKGIACDCSGMVMSVYETVKGVKLPRNSAKQLDFCTCIKDKEVKVGDLCFFATGKDPDKVSHVGIMIDDRNFIHASSSKGVVVSDITQPYYVRTFIAFGRVPD